MGEASLSAEVWGYRREHVPRTENVLGHLASGTVHSRKVPYSHWRSPVRSDTAQSGVWEPCAHLARRHPAGRRLGFIRKLSGAPLLRRFVAVRQNDCGAFL